MKVKDLVRVLKCIPPDSEIAFEVDCSRMSFSDISKKEEITLVEYDDNGEVLSKPIIEITHSKHVVNFSME